MSARAPVGPSVLIVDDEQVLCEAIGEIVRRCGYLAVTAYNGFDGIGALRGAPTPALVLLDLHMPGVTGWKFRQMQLLHPALAAVPVVITSSLDPSAQRRHELNADAYLDKSRLWEELPPLLERFCGGAAGLEGHSPQ
jgi:CheY-like chemotaxis protein